MENELSLRPGFKSGSGQSINDYPTAKAGQWAAVLRGMSRAINDVRTKTAAPLRSVVQAPRTSVSSSRLHDSTPSLRCQRSVDIPPGRVAHDTIEHPRLSIAIVAQPSTALGHSAVSSIGLIRRLPTCTQVCTFMRPRAGIEYPLTTPVRC